LFVDAALRLVSADLEQDRTIRPITKQNNSGRDLDIFVLLDQK